MAITACNEHNLVFPTLEKLDLHMNSVHYYPVKTRVILSDVNMTGTVVAHHETLGIRVKFDINKHDEYFHASQLRKMKNQRPFDPDAKPYVARNCVVHGLGFETREAAERHFNGDEYEHESKKNLSPLDPSKLPIAVSQMQSEINTMKPQRPEWPLSDFEKGRISGLETALRMLGVEL